MSKKVCLLVDSLSSGGAERVAANMSILLNKTGYNIFIVSMQNDIHYHYEGSLYNFGFIKNQYNPIRAFLEFNSYFRKHKFDVIIDHRVRTKYIKELIFAKLVFRKCKVIYCVHSYNLAYYFSFLNFPWLANLPHVKNKIFISVCVEMQKYLGQKLNIISKVIYNSLPEKETLKTSDNNAKVSTNKYVIGVGRLNKIKQFDILIKSYNNTKLPGNNVGLVILGSGPEKHNLSLLINDLNLNNRVKIIPFKKNPYGLIKNAMALVLSSKVEGFPMVLLEALSLSTPVIAFNCKSGPNEIINHNVNGLLVEDQNQKELTAALNKLLLEYFYKNMKNNTQIGLEIFSENKIIQEWINVLENQI